MDASPVFGAVGDGSLPVRDRDKQYGVGWVYWAGRGVLFLGGKVYVFHLERYLSIIDALAHGTPVFSLTSTTTKI